MYFIDNKRSCFGADDEVFGRNSLGGRVGWNDGDVLFDVTDDSERTEEELRARDEEEQVDLESDDMFACEIS